MTQVVFFNKSKYKRSKIIFLAFFILFTVSCGFDGGSYMNTTDNSNHSSQNKYNILYDPIHRQTQQQVDIVEALSRKIDGLDAGQELILESITPFEWDQVAVFGVGSSSSDINQVIGQEWLDEPDYVGEDIQVLVFLQEDEVVQHLVFQPGYIGSRTINDRRIGVLLSPDNAVFEVEVYRSPNINRVFLMLDEAIESDLQ